MLRVAVFATALGLVAATQGSHAAELTRCVHKCEAKNECRASLDSLSCEESCAALCKCSAISRRMLNKPKHCMASMLEQHQKKLNLIRMKKATIKKVVLHDDDDATPAEAAGNDFSAYVPLEDYWPQGHRAEAMKPRMLNGKKEMSLIRSKGMPWSAARHPHHRHHRHVAALIGKNVSAPVNKTKASAVAPAAPKAAPKTEPAKVSKEKTIAKAAAPAKVETPAKAATSAQEPPKVAALAKVATPAKVALAKETPKVAALAKETPKLAVQAKVVAPAKAAAKKQ